jgi:citrate synthase
MVDNLYLTAKQAADMLGISVSSLYAYVGRKNIRSQSVPGRRARLYWREDVEKIRSKSEERFVKWDSILVPETKITLITDAGHFYRGHSAIELSERCSLEEVAAILWEQDVQSIFPDTPPIVPARWNRAREALSSLSPIDQAGSLFPMLEAANPRSYDRSPLGFARAGAELLRWFASMVAGADQPTAEPVHIMFGRTLKAPSGYDDLIRRLLVLCADHELSPPTYAVRAVANAGATPYQAVAVGLVAQRGQRIIESRGPVVRRFLSEVLADANPSNPVIERYRLGEQIPGFSQGIYTSGDLRARSLLKALLNRFAKDEHVRKLREAIKVARDVAGAEPDLPLIAGFIERKLGSKLGGTSLVVVARVVGWIAHAHEQMQSGPMIRPRTAYTGALPLARG